MIVATKSHYITNITYTISAQYREINSNICPSITKYWGLIKHLNNALLRCVLYSYSAYWCSTPTNTIANQS